LKRRFILALVAVTEKEDFPPPAITFYPTGMLTIVKVKVLLEKLATPSRIKNPT
jgi:hypothetical protein